MTTFLVIALACLAVTLFYVAVRSRSRQSKVHHLDLLAFHNLNDRQDELFLRDRVSRKEFYRLKRIRIGVTWKYVRRIADNSAAVLRMAGSTRQDPDPQVIEAVAQITELATHIRVQCLIAFAKLTVEYIFPSVQLTPATLATQYESLRENVVRLGSLHPQEVASVAAAI
jgi:chromosome condensin MukBEF complex kleisin-like MukF subunit